MNIKKFRIVNNLTQQQVATTINISLSVYSRYERGERTCPIDVLVKLSKLYRISIEELIGVETSLSNELTLQQRNFLEIFNNADSRAQQDAINLLKAHKKTD